VLRRGLVCLNLLGENNINFSFPLSLNYIEQYTLMAHLRFTKWLDFLYLVSKNALQWAIGFTVENEGF